MNKNPTYTHEERQRFVEQAAKEYYAKETGGPAPLNRDFMKRDKVINMGHRRIKRYSAIAAVVALVLLSASVISMITSNKDVAYGDKGILHRLYQSIMGVETDKQDEAPAEDYLDVLEIADMDDIKKAAAFSDGQLYIPEYFPEGYTMELLTIKKARDGSTVAEYKFKKDNYALNIGVMYTAGDDQISSSGKGEMIRLKDRVLYVKEDDINNTFNIDVYTEDAVCIISGDITKAEGIRIAENLKLHP